MKTLTKISEALGRLFHKSKSKQGKKYVKMDEILDREQQAVTARGLVNTLKIKKKKIMEQREEIHRKIKIIEEKYKQGKISVDERDEQILKLLKKGVKLRKEIEKITKEINKLETYS